MNGMSPCQEEDFNDVNGYKSWNDREGKYY